MFTCLPVGIWSPSAAMRRRLHSVVFAVPRISLSGFLFPSIFFPAPSLYPQAHWPRIRRIAFRQAMANRSPDDRPKRLRLACCHFPLIEQAQSIRPRRHPHVMLLPLSGWISRACRPPRSMSEHYKKRQHQGNRPDGKFSSIGCKIQLDSTLLQRAPRISRLDSKHFSIVE